MSSSLFRFSRLHLLASFGLLLALIIIALTAHDQIIRPFMGDVLVVVWLYLLLRSFLTVTPNRLALGVLLMACCVEVLQRFDLVEWLGLGGYSVAHLILGATFDWLDFIAYFCGYLIITACRYASGRP